MDAGDACGIVLFAHGARDPAWAATIEAIRAAMLGEDRGARVEAAYLEFLSPGLPEAIDRLAGQHVTRIVVVPVFMAHSGHTKRDLPALIEAARARHPGLEIRVASPIGEATEIVGAIARYALASRARRIS